ncbi:MAG: DUF2147 domain-containing protein [Hyphomicrobiaceae bacterium]|nr:DUF2147 domain-containing protein [Hyphomicrobiaceae bacterium]
MLRIAASSAMAAFAAVATTFIAVSSASAGGDPTGVWLDDTGRGAVEISPCGGALCGKVVWVKSAADKDGCGKAILGGVKPAGSGRWDYGWIYDPERDSKFDLELTPVGSDRLKVTGYAGIKLFSETRMWKRAPADLVRCDDASTAKAAPAAGDESAAGAAKTAKADIGDAAPAKDASTPTAAGGTAPDAASASPANPATASGDAPVATAAADEATPAAPKTAGPGGLSVDKFVKKSAGGRCSVDLKWVKLDFDCKDL